jgi:hypothetical protein
MIFFPQIVQGPRREAELALSRATTKEIWRTVRLSRPRDSAILGLREWENKKMLVRQVVWHKFARRIDSSHKRTWNEWLKEWELFSSKRIKRCGKGREDSTGTRDGRQCGIAWCSCLRAVACTVPMISVMDAQVVEQYNSKVVMQQLKLAIR